MTTEMFQTQHGKSWTMRERVSEFTTSLFTMQLRQLPPDKIFRLLIWGTATFNYLYKLWLSKVTVHIPFDIGLLLECEANRYLCADFLALTHIPNSGWKFSSFILSLLKKLILNFFKSVFCLLARWEPFTLRARMYFEFTSNGLSGRIFTKYYVFFQFIEVIATMANILCKHSHTQFEICVHVCVCGGTCLHVNYLKTKESHLVKCRRMHAAATKSTQPAKQGSVLAMLGLV